MTGIIDFIVNNYLWFLIGFGILLFALIGYFFEKKYAESQGTENQNTINNKSLEPLGLNETMPQNLDNIKKDKIESQLESTEISIEPEGANSSIESLNSDIAIPEQNNLQNLLNDSVEMDEGIPLESNFELKDLPVPVGNNNEEDSLNRVINTEKIKPEIENLSEFIDIENNNNEDNLLTQNLDSVVDEFEINPVEYMDNYEDIKPQPENVDIPNIELLSKNNDTLDDEDDVWKF